MTSDSDNFNSIEPRPIRSFVLRQGRMSIAQNRAYDQLMPKFGIPFQHQVLKLDDLFQRQAPKILEIGFGMGQTTAVIAANQPNKNFIGIEVHTPGIGSLLKLLEEQNLNNVKVIQHDAVEVLKEMIAPESLQGIHIYFPDPWPKKRHQKRRLIQSEFVSLLVSKLATNSYLHLATDWQDYAEQMLNVLSKEPLLKNTANDYAERPDYRPETKFERRGINLGHGVWDLIFRKT